MNKAIIVGRLGRDPEVKHTQGGLVICDLNVATDERRKNGDQWEKYTEWHRVTVFGRQAESCQQYLGKGSQVGIEGRIQTDVYEKDGERRYSTKIVADRVEFLGGGRSDTQQQSSSSASGYGGYGQQGGAYTPPGAADDLPF